MSRDTKELHKAEQVAEILTMADQGYSQEAIRKKLCVAPLFVQNVLANESQTCADPECKREFFAHKKGQRFGSQECYYTAVKKLGTA